MAVWAANSVTFIVNALHKMETRGRGARRILAERYHYFCGTYLAHSERLGEGTPCNLPVANLA